ncbi:hypothetical protein HW555_002437 [Spodoptera exigua]|uniref:Uncharacterized protein n=1 Tax=Spodoptera exigua TaxID=7107 RepID=A0A835GQC8_SPOEX|nr:hypothetical protein HW555_002437 [Spodoptera exigua]
MTLQKLIVLSKCDTTMSEIWRKQDVIGCTYNERTTKAALAASSAITSCSTTISFITGIPPNTAAITCFCAVLTAHYPCSSSNPQVLQTQQECCVLGSTSRAYAGIIEGISAAELERIAKEEERKWFWQNGKEKEEKEQSGYKELKSGNVARLTITGEAAAAAITNSGK